MARTKEKDLIIVESPAKTKTLSSFLGGGYEIVETRHFLILGPESDGVGRMFLQSAEDNRAALRSFLGDVADFDRFGRTAVVVLEPRDTVPRRPRSSG